MRLDMTNVEEKSYLKQGKHFVKVIKQEETFSHNGKPILKVTFQDKNGATISDDFYLTDQAMFRVKMFTKALKMPNIIDTELMVDRYVNIDVMEEPYTDKNGNSKVAYKIANYEESNQTNTLDQKDALLQIPITVMRDNQTDEETIPF